MYVDEVVIELIAGNGGDGCTSAEMVEEDQI